jgi:hypothetical protein
MEFGFMRQTIDHADRCRIWTHFSSCETPETTGPYRPIIINIRTLQQVLLSNQGLSAKVHARSGVAITARSRNKDGLCTRFESGLGRCIDLAPTDRIWKSLENHRENDGREKQQPGQELRKDVESPNSSPGPAAKATRSMLPSIFN